MWQWERDVTSWHQTHTHAHAWPTHVVAFVPLPSAPLAIHFLQLQHVRSPGIGQPVCRRSLILQQSLLFLLHLRLLTYGSYSIGISTDVSGNLLPPVSNTHKPRSIGTNEHVFFSDIAATRFGCKQSSSGSRDSGSESESHGPYYRRKLMPYSSGQRRKDLSSMKRGVAGSSGTS